jgi:hypothetical protein
MGTLLSKCKGESDNDYLYNQICIKNHNKTGVNNGIQTNQTNGYMKTF